MIDWCLGVSRADRHMVLDLYRCHLDQRLEDVSEEEIESATPLTSTPATTATTPGYNIRARADDDTGTPMPPVPRPRPQTKSYNRTSLNSTSDLRTPVQSKKRKAEEDEYLEDEDEDEDDDVDQPHCLKKPLSKKPKSTNMATDVIKRQNFVKRLMTFRVTVPPWTEEEKNMCELFTNCPDKISYEQVKAQLADMDFNVDAKISHKIYHKIRGAWANTNKMFASRDE